jgi:hypothetical protein
MGRELAEAEDIKIATIIVDDDVALTASRGAGARSSPTPTRSSTSWSRRWPPTCPTSPATTWR